MVDSKASVVDHDEVRTQVARYLKDVDKAYWNLAETLHEVYNGGYYVQWGFKNFREFVEKELEFQVRKGETLVRIYDWAHKLNPAAQEWIKSIGWTKASMLVDRVKNDNFQDWKNSLGNKTVRQIQEVIKESNSGDGLDDDDGEDKNKPSSKPIRKGITFSPDQLSNFESALELYKGLANTDKDSVAADMMATEGRIINGGMDDPNEYWGKTEKSFGVRVVVYDESTETIVYGDELIDQILSEGDEE